MHKNVFALWQERASLFSHLHTEFLLCKVQRFSLCLYVCFLPSTLPPPNLSSFRWRGQILLTRHCYHPTLSIPFLQMLVCPSSVHFTWNHHCPSTYHLCTDLLLHCDPWVWLHCKLGRVSWETLLECIGQFADSCKQARLRFKMLVMLCFT